jgi:fermentation-respiration switch protein FrsA (DUF1100 family)
MRNTSLLLGLFVFAGCLSMDSFMFNPTKITPPDTYTFIPQDEKFVPETITADCEPQLLDFESEDGTKLFAVFIPGALGVNGPAILYNHGNARNLDEFTTRLQHFCNHGYTSMMVDYRGYGLSEGEPTEPGLYQDARAALRQFLTMPGVNRDHLIFYGMSLGSAVATELAFEAAKGELKDDDGVIIEPTALILDSPFASVQAIVNSSTFVAVPVEDLASVRFDNLSKIDQLSFHGENLPLLLMHGVKDDFIPIRFGEELFDKAQEPKIFVAFPEADHVELEFSDVQLYDQSMEFFLEEFVVELP